MAASPLKTVGAPTIGANSDAGKAFKLAQQVENILAKCINSVAKQLKPQALLVDPSNRDGAPPNVMHVHHTILKSFQENGFDKTRPQTGICVQYTSTEGKLKLLEHNRRFTAGTPTLPPVIPDTAMYGTLAGSHLNLALRILVHGVASPAADVTSMIEPGSSLEEVTKDGHKWFILPEETALSDRVNVSLWRNQDQRGRLRCTSRALLH